MNASETKLVKSYFRGDAKFGRTTKLVHKATGELLAEGMGDCTKSQLLAQYASRARLEADFAAAAKR